MKGSARKEVLTHVETLMAQYCEGCFLHRQLIKDGGRRRAHQFCISQCTIGEQIKEFGKKLS
ncbi:zinc-finger domain-containing protein [Bacillus salipaludis]|uniref:Zinc-finger domain-containing protein n=1 Tax=Bacillus salipaludis TaxID=2547811 RepID=A0A4R5VRL0_9BACI|nr:zinc-finger domain-containing protein [Bacillus salipaludis]MDQ6599391.1 zinc-finger domain-containing protein [Bacillus salipaludis]TDK60332.1 zinc-finger domain-containing protein [Bacillus salipaludis]